MKLAYFVGDQHAMSQWLIKWSEQAGEGFRRPHHGQALPRRRRWVRCSSTTTSPAPARPTSSWFLHGATPGRFPLTEMSQVPYLVGSAEIGTKVLNDPELRSKYLDAEHAA